MHTIPPGKRQAPIKAILWDIDGTLIDSEPLHYQSLVKICERYGYAINATDSRALVGKNLAAIWSHLYPQFKLPIAEPQWRTQVIEYYSQHVSPAMQREGAIALVTQLAQQGIKQACVSSGEAPIVDANLSVLGLRPFLQCVISCDDVRHTKPHPEPYLLAANRLQLPPRQCLVVEDSKTGIASAMAAGMTTVAWPHTMSNTDDCDQADFVITELKQFPWQLLPGLSAMLHTAVHA